jgi:hypothetical protein
MAAAATEAVGMDVAEEVCSPPAAAEAVGMDGAEEVCSPALTRLRSAKAAPVVMAKKSGIHGNGLFLKGPVCKGDEIVFFEGNPVEQCSWGKEDWERRGVSFDLQKTILGETQVGMPIGQSMTIVHAPLLELALNMHAARPQLRLGHLMGVVDKADITDAGGNWWFINDVLTDASKVNVKVYSEPAKGQNATKRLVWKATRDINPGENGEELFYAYDRSKLRADATESEDENEAEAMDETASEAEREADAEDEAEVETEEGEAGAAADSYAAQKQDQEQEQEQEQVHAGAEAEAMDQSADGAQDAAAAATPDAKSDEVTKPLPLGWPYETHESPFQTMPDEMFTLLIGRVLSHLVKTIDESGDLRLEAFNRTRVSAASKSMKPCRAWTTLRETQRAIVTTNATLALPRSISDRYIALAFGPALLTRVLMQMRGCSLLAAQEIVDSDCPEYRDHDGHEKLAEDREEGDAAGDTAGAAAASPRGLFDLGQALQRSLPLLYDIQAGRAPHWSSRHVTFLQGGKARRGLKRGYNFGGLGPDDAEVICDFMRERFNPYTETTNVPDAACSYIMDVLVPDCIVYLVMQKYRCSHYDAIGLTNRSINTPMIPPAFTADETHDSLVESAIADGRYKPATYRPTPPLPVKLAKEEGAQMPDASACFAKSPAASMATGSAYACLAAAVTHMSTTETAGVTEHASAEAWRADVEIGTAALLASPYVGKPTIGHSPYVSPMESVGSMAMAGEPLKGLAAEDASRAVAIRRRCTQLKTCPRVQIDLSDFGEARLGGGFVKDLIAGALTCRKGAAEIVPQYDGYDHEVHEQTQADEAALLKLQKTALLITHGTSTYAVLVHEDGTVAFRDPHSLDQLNFSSSCSFLAWVEQQLAFAGSAALPSTYFRWNPLWPATAIFGIVIIPPATATEESFDVGSVQSMYDSTWLPPQLAEPPAEASLASPAKDWLHRCLFWDQGPLTGGWTEGAVTRTHDEKVSITLKPKVLTAAAEAEELCIDNGTFAEAFPKRARWATAVCPHALFLKENADLSPPCQFCGNPMQWFATKEVTTANCHGVCCNYQAVDYAAVIHGGKVHCASVFGTSQTRPGQVFGCRRCPNDVGPVGPRDGNSPASGSGLYRCHLLCASCRTYAEKGLHGLDPQVLRPAGEHFWQIGRQADGKRLPAGNRAVNAFVVAQWLSPSSAKRLVDETSRMGRLNLELTETELAMDADAPNYLSLGRRSRGGPIFNYLPGELAFGCPSIVANAVRYANVPFPPNSYNLRQQFELSKDGNNGFTCSAADFPFLAIARKYEECCFLRAMAMPDRPFGRKEKPVPYILVGSKILMSGRETPLCGAGDGDNIAEDKPSRVETVQCNSMGRYAVEVHGANPTVAKDVLFDAKSGQFTHRVRRYRTSQQLHHHDASQDQAQYTRKTGNPFWSCVGSLSADMRLNVNGFNVRLSAGLCGVQTGTNPHCGSGGYQEPRTHTYIDIDFKKARATSHLHTVFDSFTTLLGLDFDKKGALRFNLTPLNTDPNLAEEDEDENDDDEDDEGA